MPKENYEAEVDKVDGRSAAEEEEEECWEDDDELTTGEQGFIKGCELAGRKDADEE